MLGGKVHGWKDIFAKCIYRKVDGILPSSSQNEDSVIKQAHKPQLLTSQD
jgi:hypothetical protein